uniref:Pyridoxal phosphate homeostasis protein n=1 Tax=Fibrocapsa japonica TaxID=94617 RepID=A0A7S2V490_9STRA|mmetsp:Transcript_657/g.952  ORF Transcript_657/g.952 Transcript_657/m.952 type:complete len:242 (+) Transcript_657:1-726(+)|eukprot:CAMPEP_0113943244 /NCGR_PEP_ID=MMETSP1339-20121228/21989_1 /TAXON_ID=94617 /ORGANISM="Fibrocapsa japonica" /LENGTH=241 /DNA_ID=CAMNT_0000948067 /DNA_START=1 /DNA_END=726 /DNA_ORIENTATION=+ /assembly_acc=CAM_ASM_000762
MEGDSGNSPIVSAIESIREQISDVCQRSGLKEARLVAVSKTKPSSDIEEAYNGCGQLHFGENYVQEIVEKAPQLPDDICWHFIGHVQSNKARPLVEGVPNLWSVETVDSVKLANALNKACMAIGREAPLGVMVQVNTSGETQKSGVAPEDCLDLARHISESCPSLKFQGLMTIGRLGDPSPDCFQCLLDCRKQVSEALGLGEEELEMSMGMSGDLELALEMGSTNVRVGSTIFGARTYANK